MLKKFEILGVASCGAMYSFQRITSTNHRAVSAVHAGLAVGLFRSVEIVDDLL